MTEKQIAPHRKVGGFLYGASRPGAKAMGSILIAPFVAIWDSTRITLKITGFFVILALVLFLLLAAFGMFILTIYALVKTAWLPAAIFAALFYGAAISATLMTKMLDWYLETISD